MKIAFIVDSFPKLSETFILDQITSLIDLGHDIRIFSVWSRINEQAVHSDVAVYGLLERTAWPAPTPRSRFVRPFIAAWLLLAGLFTSPYRTIPLFRLLVANLRDFSLRKLRFLMAFPSDDFDVVHCHYGHNGILALQLRQIGALSSRTKIVATFHGYDEHIQPVEALRAQYKPLFREAALLTVNTLFTRNKIVELGADPEKVVVLPVGLRMDRFVPCAKDPSPGRVVRILSVARLVEKKGLTYAIDAIALLKDRFSLAYTIAGDGPLRAQLEEQVRRLGLGSVVSFAGAVNQALILEMYARADIFLLPSVTAGNGEMEGQGLVLQEAQACGIPVVSTLHNGIPEGVLDGQTGVLVQEKDAKALASAIEILVNDASKRREFGAKGREWVEARYDIRRLSDRLTQEYERLASL
ncbi:MAG TPA: glycosyltransferase [Sedimentisphaerales bacterium]|nr:glycosyltransferase [Sedimentisphaerales bacterium]